MAITGDQIKTAIEKRLAEMVKARNAYIKSGEFLFKLGIKIDGVGHKPYFCDCVETVAGLFIDQLCEELTAKYANGTPARVGIDAEFFKTISETKRNYRDKNTLFDLFSDQCNSDEALIALYIASVDFNAIAESINQQVLELNDTGLKLFSSTIIRSLGLSNLDGYFRPYAKGRFIICHRYPTDYFKNHETLKDLTPLMNALYHVQNEADMSFGPALNEYMQAIRDLNYSIQKIPSRTVFGKGRHLEIHCFKDKHELRFSSQAMEAIFAFLSLNGHEELVEKLMSRFNMLEAA